jgi:hypothetical protein
MHTKQLRHFRYDCSLRVNGMKLSLIKHVMKHMGEWMYRSMYFISALVGCIIYVLFMLHKHNSSALEISQFKKRQAFEKRICSTARKTTLQLQSRHNTAPTSLQNSSSTTCHFPTRIVKRSKCHHSSGHTPHVRPTLPAEAVWHSIT